MFRECDCFVEVTLIVLSMIYAVAIGDKVKFTELDTGRVLCKMMFLMFFCSRKNICVGISFVIKLKALIPVTLLKKRLQHRSFPVNIAKNF